MRGSHFLLICFFTSFSAILGLPAKSQLIPDQTLGAESSTLSDTDINGLPTNLIEGGATRGGNLFHSFLEFNVDENKQIYFNSPAGIDSILSRVTGSNLSDINGLLGTTGESNAALILMNPNGIVFGENASLDVQGAFTATTASGIQLGEEGLFSAVDPKTDSLLSISPSAFFFSSLVGEKPKIEIAGSQGLKVPSGEDLLLLGGDVLIDGSSVVSPGSRIEIVAVEGAGAARINEDSKIVLDEGIERGNIIISNGSVANVRSAEGGDVRLTADDIQIRSGSSLLVGVPVSVNSVEDKAGYIEINATGLVQISGAGTTVESGLQRGSGGRANGVVILADSIEVAEAAVVNASTETEGRGNAGNVTLKADSNILIDDAFVFTFVDEDAVGQSGDVLLSADNIEVLGGSILATLVSGEGDAGNVNITATETIEVLGGNADRVSILSGVEEDKGGNGGDINISAANLNVGGGSLLATTINGSGDAGAILIDVSNNARFGVTNSPILSSITTLTDERSLQQGGNIEISAANVEVLNGFRISTATFGGGDAGNLSINASDSLQIDGINSVAEQPVSSMVGSFLLRGGGTAGDVEIVAGSLEVTNGGFIDASTFEDSNAGVIQVDVSETARFDGFNSKTFFPSGIRSSGSETGIGRGGRIRLSAANLEVTGGAQLLALSAGKGDAGNIAISVSETVRLDGSGSGPSGAAPSSISSSVLEGGSGNGGNVEVTANNLEMTNGADISSGAFGQGNAGEIVIDVVETVRVDGINPVIQSISSGIRSDIGPDAEGQGGNVQIAAANIELTDGGQISTSTSGKGDAGQIILNVSETVLVDGVSPVAGNSSSGISSGVQTDAKGQGGSLEIAAANLEVVNGGQIDTSIFGEGRAGNIFIDVAETVLISGKNPLNANIPSSVGSGVELNGSGQGGNIEIASTNLYVVDNAQISASSSGEGSAGRISLRIDEQVRVEDDGDIVTLSSANFGGDISIRAGGVLLRDNGDISTLVSGGTGTGGNINIAADYAIALEDSDILAFSTEGRGGNIDLMQTTLFSQDISFAAEDISTLDLFALDGNGRVDINATGGVESGEVFINDASFVENDIAELADELIDADELIASTCISGNEGPSGTFVARGSDRISQSPTNLLTSPYSLDTVRPINATQPVAIQEPQDIYQLANGRLVISHRCEK